MSASLSAQAHFCNGIEPCRVASREGGAPCEAVQSRSLESILGYGFIIESTRQQYELKAIHVLFPPSPGCHSCAASLLVLAQFFVGAMLCSWFDLFCKPVFCSHSQCGFTTSCASVTEWVGDRKGGKNPWLLMPHALPNTKPALLYSPPE